MSEYIEIDTEESDDGTRIYFYTNLQLAPEEDEQYESVAEMEEGSPVAQAISVVAGITSLTLSGSEMVLTREANFPWHLIVGDVTAVLKDFFL